MNIRNKRLFSHADMVQKHKASLHEDSERSVGSTSLSDIHNFEVNNRKSLFAAAHPQIEEIVQQSENPSRLSEHPSDVQSNNEEVKRLPKRKMTDKTKKKMTIIYGKQKEIDKAAQQLEEKKLILKSRDFSQTNLPQGVSIQSDQKAKIELVYNSDKIYKAVEKSLNKNHAKKLLKGLAWLFFCVNLTVIAFCIGINVYLVENSKSYTEYNDLQANLNTNFKACRRLLWNFIMTSALKSGSISNNRYSLLLPLFSSEYQQQYSDFGIYLEGQRNKSILFFESSSSSIINLAINKGLKEVTGSEMIDLKSQLSSSLSTSNIWSFVSGHVLRLGGLVYQMNQFLLSKEPLPPLIENNSLDYLMNFLQPDEDKIVGVIADHQSTAYVNKLDDLQYLVFSIVFVVIVVILVGIVYFVLIAKKFENVLKLFSQLTPRDINERKTQLKVVVHKMERFKDSLYYSNEQLEEGYVLPSDDRENVKPISLTVFFKKSRFIFENLLRAASTMLTSYILLAGLALALLILLALKKEELVWLEEKKTVSQKMVKTYSEHFNEVYSMLLLPERTIKNLPLSQFFSDYDKTIRTSMNLVPQLVTESSLSSTQYSSSLSSFIRSVYNKNICPLADPSLLQVCSQIDNKYPEQGLSQIETRLASFFTQIYFQKMIQYLQPATIINQPDFVQVELSFNEIYSKIAESILEKAVSSKTSAVADDSSMLACTIAVSAFVLVIVALGFWAFGQVGKTASFTYFGYLMISLDTYRSNFPLHKSLVENLEINV